MLVGAVVLVFAVTLGAVNWGVSDRSADRSGETFVDAVLAALPPDAAILSEWDASTPLWHARWVLDRRPDILIVDDTNIVYDGWGTRERRIAALICVRPVFILRLDEVDLEATRAAYRLEPFLAVRVAAGGPSADVTRELFRVAPLDQAQCHDGPAASYEFSSMRRVVLRRTVAKRCACTSVHETSKRGPAPGAERCTSTIATATGMIRQGI